MNDLKNVNRDAFWQRYGATDFCLMASGAGEHLYRALGYETHELAAYWLVNPTTGA